MMRKLALHSDLETQGIGIAGESRKCLNLLTHCEECLNIINIGGMKNFRKILKSKISDRESFIYDICKLEKV